MLKNVFVPLILCLMLSVNVAFAKSPKESIEMIEGFKGIYIGISLEDFLKIRPNANVHPMEMYSEDQKVDLTKPDQWLEESVENDPLFGVSMLGGYTFRGGKLENIMLIWVGDMGHIRKHRDHFISSCIKRWGYDFQKKVARLEPGKKEEQLAPVLLWEKGNIRIAVGCSGEYKKRTLREGVFSISMFSKDDSDFSSAVAGERVDEELRNELFKGIGIHNDNNDGGEKGKE